MTKNLQKEAQALLDQPVTKTDIPVQRATFALGTSITVGHGKFHVAEYHIYPTNLYLTFSSRAARDQNGNYDSPIFQDSFYNSYKPLWQEFRERVMEKLGTSVACVYLGEYKGKGQDQEFVVKDEPKDCRWRYTKKRYARKDKDSVFITRVTKEQALEYQGILDDLRFERALKIVEDIAVHEESRLCREEAILTLNGKYSEDFERFTFGDETFRFRQFNTEFLYTTAGLEAFDDFYVKVCVPYRNDEIANAEWRERSRELEEHLANDTDFGPEFRFNGAHGFKLTRQGENNCLVESDLIDDRTGRPFNMTVNSQRFDDILNAVSTELTVVFQRKKQARRATSYLQKLASNQ